MKYNKTKSRSFVGVACDAHNGKRRLYEEPAYSYFYDSRAERGMTNFGINRTASYFCAESPHKNTT